jgi:molybdenum cofactor cytidylyltransferase
MTDGVILLLAAGASRRMGQPKALLPWGKIPLIQFQIEKFSALGLPLIVVLGAHQAAVEKTLRDQSVRKAINPRWVLGMGSSIALGIKYINHHMPQTKHVVICSVDQPLVTASYVQQLLEKLKTTSATIVNSRSADGWQGIPVGFDAIHFEELKRLDGDQGARAVVSQHPQTTLTCEAGKQLEDMDTPEAYKKVYAQFLSRQSES